MAEHTPGPWKADLQSGFISFPSPGCENARASVGAIQAHGNSKAELRANARLIAAAPELLAALEAAAWFPWVHNAAITQDIEALRDICKSYADWWNSKAVPAIAKAKGK